jgi:flagellar motor switch protein FliG
MDGTRKTAVLLLSLDQAVAAALLRKLPRDQVERVTLAIANAENVTRDEQEQVLTEFKSVFVSRPLMQPVGPETARELLERSLDQPEVESMQIRIDEQIEAGAFAFLHHRHADDIRRLIEAEHSQTIAVIAAQLPPDLAAQVLAGFAADTQADILARLARLGPTNANVLDEIATSLKDRIGPVPVRTGGVSRASDVLRESARTTSRSVLKSIEQMDARLGGALRETLFSFQDIQNLDDVTLRTILQKTDQCRWAVALKGNSETLRQRVLTCLPNQVAKALTEEMKSIGPVRLSEITDAQSQIIDMTLSLELENEIEISLRKTRARRAEDYSKTTRSRETVPFYSEDSAKSGQSPLVFG